MTNKFLKFLSVGISLGCFTSTQGIASNSVKKLNLTENCNDTHVAVLVKDGKINQSDIDSATRAYREGGLIYVYGQKVTIGDFLKATSSDVYFGNCEGDSDRKDLAFTSIQSDDSFCIISGFNMRFWPQRWKQEMVSFDSVPSNEELLNLVNDDVCAQKQRSNSGIKKEVVRIKSSTGIKCYLNSLQSTYLFADWTLLQDVDERDEEQNYFGFTTLITPVSNLLMPCNLVYVQQRVMNSGGVLSDYAPSDSTDLTLNVGVSAGTSGVDVSVSTDLTTKPTFVARSYPDITAAAFQWMTGSIPVPGGLNNIGFRSGIAWHANTTYPSVRTTFYGSFAEFTTSAKTITASKFVEDIH